MDFLNLMANAMFVLTDSGGIQEETTVLGVPCLTMRKNTERPITVSQGTNTLVGNSYAKITGHAAKILSSKPKKHSIPEFWDGNASKRIVKVLLNNLMKFV
jgi:UDP-N-acetylglucosamine 2-epimerase (non-hydrolysing)